MSLRKSLPLQETVKRARVVEDRVVAEDRVPEVVAEDRAPVVAEDRAVPVADGPAVLVVAVLT